MVTKDRLRCENIGSVFYSSIKPYLSQLDLKSILFKLPEKGLHLNGEPFFVSEYYRKVCIKSCKLV